MGDEATRYDPYIPAESATMSAGAGSSRTAQIQAQIDETVGVMRDNINRVNERGENLDALQDKTDNLAVSAQGFRRGANQVRKRMWWKDVKMRLLIVLAIIILCVSSSSLQLSRQQTKMMTRIRITTKQPPIT